MDELTIQLTPQMLALVPAVAAILQMLKRIPQVAIIKEWLPLVSIGLAIGLCYLAGMESPILPSIIIGMAASGGYDLLKKPKELGKK